jgi:small-conductance mechanosensitive channel
MFISSGFLISSLLDKFVLNKLFEILRSEPGTQNTISKITHYLILGVAILLGFFSIHLEQFILLIGGLLGIGLGFALKDVVADFVAGFFVLIERPIEIGNYIQVDTVEGTVHKISPRTTTIITSRNFAVFIPNKDLLAKNIVNWSHRRFAMGFEIYVRVTHESDPDFVRKVIIEILQSHSAVLKLPAVVARLEEFEENSFYFMSRAFISTQRLKESWAIASDLRIKLVKAFKENGINFAKPQRIVYVNEVTNETRVEEKKALSIKFDKE